MKKDIGLPLLALLGGAAGFILRRVQMATGFEPDSGLPVSGNLPALGLILLTLALAVAFFLLCRGGHPVFRGYDDAFLSYDPSIRAICNGAAIFLMAAGAFRALNFLTVDWPQTSMTVAMLRAMGGSPLSAMLSGALLPVLSVLFCLGSAISLFLIARNNYWGEANGHHFLPLLIPGFGSCLWLLLTYRSRSDDPVLTLYAYQLLAILCITVALYLIAGFSFSRAPAPGATLFFSLMAVYFSLVTLGDGHDLTNLCLLLSAVLYFSSQSFALLHNSAGLPLPLPPIRPDEDEDDD